MKYIPVSQKKICPICKKLCRNKNRTAKTCSIKCGLEFSSILCGKKRKKCKKCKRTIQRKNFRMRMWGNGRKTGVRYYFCKKCEDRLSSHELKIAKMAINRKKFCSKCKKFRAFCEFYKHKRFIHGLSLWCGKCLRGYHKLKRDGIKHKETHRLYQAKWRRKKGNKIKEVAHNAVNHFIKLGKIKRLPCKICGKRRVHAHHPDYKKPLRVIWLCPLHHMQLHRKERMYA